MWRSRGAEVGQEPRVAATDRGAGREALSGGGREAWRAAGGFKKLFEPPGLTSGLGGPALLFTQEEVREEEEAEPPWAAGRTTKRNQECLKRNEKKNLRLRLKLCLNSGFAS